MKKQVLEELKERAIFSFDRFEKNDALEIVLGWMAPKQIESMVDHSETMKRTPFKEQGS
jgi:hypothetical protein